MNMLDRIRMEGQLKGLNHALSILAARRARKNSPDYTAALGDVEVFLKAAIERVELGQGMSATAETQPTRSSPIAKTWLCSDCEAITKRIGEGDAPKCGWCEGEMQLVKRTS